MEDRGPFASRFRPAAVVAPPAPARAGIGGHDPFFLGSDHQGAANSPLRGYVYWRTTDTRRQISNLTDREIRRRVDFLYQHFGFCRRLINGLAKLCGILTPQPDTPDEDWNDRAFDAFMFGAKSPDIFDQGAKFDFFEAQVQWNRDRFKNGRSLAVLTETGSGRASHAFYEAHQFANDHLGENGERVRMGTLVNRFSRHLAYYLLDGEDPAAPPRRYDAEDCLYLGKFENHGQIHPLSILAFAVANMVDVVEVRGFWKSAIKSTATRGEVIEEESQAPPSSSGGGAGTVAVEVTRPDGSKEVIQKRMVYGGSEILRLAPGQKLRTITDDRPSKENLEFERAVLEDCVFGVDLPPAALFHIAGITGPGVRFVMEDIERWILLQHLWQARKCQAIYARTLAKEMKAGRLTEPAVQGRKVEWWRPGYTPWLGLPSMTIDRGRDARMSVIRLDVGLSTWGDEYAKDGAFWKKKIHHRAREVAFAKRCVWDEHVRLQEETGGAVSLAYEEVIRRPNSSMLAALADTPGDDDDEPPRRRSRDDDTPDSDATATP